MSVAKGIPQALDIRSQCFVERDLVNQGRQGFWPSRQSVGALTERLRPFGCGSESDGWHMQHEGFLLHTAGISDKATGILQQTESLDVPPRGGEVEVTFACCLTVP